MQLDALHQFKKKASEFQYEAHQIFAKCEASASRIITLDQQRRLLGGLSLQQDALFQEALGCIEMGIYRAAHVMAWAGFMDFLERKLASEGLVKVKLVKPGWARYNAIEEIREEVPEHQLVEAARDVKLLTKSEAKTLLGLLSKRNECAHPTGYCPSLNESLGYVNELLNRIERLCTKSL